MGTFGARRLRKHAVSRERSRRTVETIEAYLGRAIGGDSGDNKASEKTSSKTRVANDNEPSLGKTRKR